jgi:hypothetical protein
MPDGQGQAATFNLGSADRIEVLRGPQGISLQAGTSTGRTQRDTCYAALDAPNVRGREGAEYLAGCKTLQPYLTTIKGSASYTVPKIDILVSTVFQSLKAVIAQHDTFMSGQSCRDGLGNYAKWIGRVKDSTILAISRAPRDQAGLVELINQVK